MRRDELGMRVIDLNTSSLGSQEPKWLEKVRTAVADAGCVMINLKLNQRGLDMNSEDVRPRSGKGFQILVGLGNHQVHVEDKLRRSPPRGLHPEGPDRDIGNKVARSEEHTSELQSQAYLLCRLLLEKKKQTKHKQKK